MFLGIAGSRVFLVTVEFQDSVGILDPKEPLVIAEHLALEQADIPVIAVHLDIVPRAVSLDIQDSQD